MSNFSFTQYLLFQAIQLVVHIARCDWPDKYPDFYSNILSLVSSPSPSTTVVGLLFLQTASEELGTPRDDVLSSRKTELKQRLLHFVPQTLSVLTGIKLLSDLYCVQNGCLNFVAPHRFTWKYLGKTEPFHYQYSSSITYQPFASQFHDTQLHCRE